MLNLQIKHLAKAAAGSALALAIVATPPLLAPAVDLGASAEAADWPRKKSKYKKEKRKTRFQAVTESFGRKLDSLTKASEAKDWKTYEDILNGMRSRFSKYNNAEKIAFHWREIELLQSRTDQLGPDDPIDYTPVLNRYEKLLAFHNDMAESAIRQILFIIATIHLHGDSRSDYLKALDYFHEWLNMSDQVKPQQKFLIAQTHLQLQDQTRALEWVEEAIADTLAQGKVPKESWYQVQKYIYYERKNHRRVAEILETMVRYFPKVRYWRELGATYQQGLERQTDGMVVFDSIYLQGKLTRPSFLKALAFSYLNQDAPYQMAEVLEWGMSKGYLKDSETNLKYLYQALLMANETKKSISALERYNRKASDAQMMLNLADQYIQVKEYKKAISMASMSKKARKKAKKKGRADFTVGVAQFYLKNYKESLKAFKQAAKDPKTEGTAKPWISYVADRISELENIAERERLLRKSLAEAS